VRAAGQSFVVCHATYGTTEDTRFGEYCPAAKAAGLRCGSSHLFRSDPTLSVDAQAEAFLTALLTLSVTLDLAPVLDIGHNTAFDGRITDPALFVQRMTQWLEQVRGELGVAPFVRTNPAFWRFLGEPAQIARAFPLWLAHYTSREPLVPAGWKSYAVWQHTSTGHVDGVGTRVNMNTARHAPWA
jgi:lysozyme